jgi:hypothetical protein
LHHTLAPHSCTTFYKKNKERKHKRILFVNGFCSKKMTRKKVTAEYVLKTLLKTPSKRPREEEEETPLSKRLKFMTREEKTYVQRNLYLQYMKEKGVGTLASNIPLPLQTSFKTTDMDTLRKSFKDANQRIVNDGSQHVYRIHPLMEKMLERKNCTVVSLCGLSKEKEFVGIEVPPWHKNGRWFFPRDMVNIAETTSNCLGDDSKTLYKFTREEDDKVRAQKITSFSVQSIEYDEEQEKKEVPLEKVEIPYS